MDGIVLKEVEPLASTLPVRVAVAESDAETESLPVWDAVALLVLGAPVPEGDWLVVTLLLTVVLSLLVVDVEADSVPGLTVALGVGGTLTLTVADGDEHAVLPAEEY